MIAVGLLAGGGVWNAAVQAQSSDPGVDREEAGAVESEASPGEGSTAREPAGDRFDRRREALRRFAEERERRSLRPSADRAEFPRRVSPESRPDAGERPSPDWRGREDGAPPRRGREHHGAAEPLTDEQVKRRLEILRQFRPELAERIEAAYETNPERVKRALGQPWLRSLARAAQADPEATGLAVGDRVYDFQSRELARELDEARRVGDQERVEAIRAELREVVAKHFDIRQQLREQMLQRMERRLEQLRERVQERAAKREQLIDSRLEELVGTHDEAGW